MAEELRDFVSMILREIVLGVKDAQPLVEEQGSFLVPRVDSKTTRMSLPIAGPGLRIVDYVEFDVALTAIKGDDTNLGVTLSVINIGGGTKDEQSTVSRVKFKVPISLPLSPSAKFDH